MGSETNEGSRTEAPLALYANYFDVGHNAYEFLIDFGQYRPESEEVALHTRIVLGPTYAKLLTDLFLNAIKRYEADHGPIPMADDAVNPLEVIHSSLPDFEHRALDARRAALSPLGIDKHSSKKR